MTETNTDFVFVEPGALAYMVTTGIWEFTPEDKVFEVEASKNFHALVDGPFSTYAMAERAADIRARGLLTVEGQMEPYGVGGHTGPHGSVSAWTRALTIHDFTGVFGDQEGWQTISISKTDVLP